MIKWQRIGKVLYCSFFVLLFTKIFWLSEDVDWKTKFVVFSVPALTYPGGDLRNIQVSAYCKKQGGGGGGIFWAKRMYR
jgi:hypothetical protein